VVPRRRQSYPNFPSYEKGGRDFRFWHFSDMPTDAENVCLLGQNGSNRGAVRAARLTHNGHWRSPAEPDTMVALLRHKAGS
jgi:hypothetical protein